MASSPAINHRSPIANSLLSTTSYPTALDTIDLEQLST